MIGFLIFLFWFSTIAIFLLIWYIDAKGKDKSRKMERPRSQKSIDAILSGKHHSSQKSKDSSKTW